MTWQSAGLIFRLESPRVIRLRPGLIDKAMGRLDHRPGWHRQRKLDLPRHPAEKYLQGWAIVLDPGHGGEAHQKGYKRGPTGVREAEINWRAGKLLER